MIGALKLNRGGWLLAACLAGAACSQAPDPASQEPVDPAPGLYEITLSGAGLLKAAGKSDPDEFCLTERDRASFPHLLARNYYQLHAACRPSRAPREGNAFGGEISCAADPKMAQGMNRFVYEGVVAADNVRVEIRMKLEVEIKEDAMTEAEAAQLKLGMKMFERARFVIEAERIGDCA